MGGPRRDDQQKRRAWQRHALLAKPHMQPIATRETDRVADRMLLDDLAARLWCQRECACEPWTTAGHSPFHAARAAIEGRASVSGLGRGDWSVDGQRAAESGSSQGPWARGRRAHMQHSRLDAAKGEGKARLVIGQLV